MTRPPIDIYIDSGTTIESIVRKLIPALVNAGVITTSGAVGAEIMAEHGPPKPKGEK